MIEFKGIAYFTYYYFFYIYIKYILIILFIYKCILYFRPTSNNKQWMIKSDNNLNLVILGSNGLAEEFSDNLKVIVLRFLC